MNDLPPFLQMFVRLFAALALGVWLHLMAVREPEKKTDKERERQRTEQLAAQQAKVDEAAKPACPHDEKQPE